jgi:rRNA maturation RNase YbeY
MKIPSSNIQAPEKHQTPGAENTGCPEQFWRFGFGISLDVGAWSFFKMPLHLRNRQRTRKVDLRQFRKIIQAALGNLAVAPDSELCFHLVAAPEMTRVNETFLHHAGSTDVITFDYADHASRTTHHASQLHGEILICLDEAVTQAKKFRTTWQSEMVRYLVHGVLHLQGFDDHRAADRRKMKREENRLLRELSRRFPISKLAQRRPPS